MPFVTCAACGCDTLILFGSQSPGQCRSCASPLAGSGHDEPWVVRIEHPGFDVIKVGGELTGDAIAPVAAELDAGAERAVILDLAHCTFIDGAAIELMTSSAAAAACDPAFFSVIGARGAVARMLDFADAAQAIPRFAGIEAALADLENEPTMM